MLCEPYVSLSIVDGPLISVSYRLPLVMLCRVPYHVCRAGWWVGDLPTTLPYRQYLPLLSMKEEEAVPPNAHVLICVVA